MRFHERDEGQREGRARALPVGDEPEGAVDLQVADREGGELPRAALVLDRPPRDDRDADARADRLLDRLRRAHLAHDPARPEVQPGSAERALERLARARAAPRARRRATRSFSPPTDARPAPR